MSEQDISPKDQNIIKGFIVEGSKGNFLTASFTWAPEKKPLDGFIHNTETIRNLRKCGWRYEFPVKLYPASTNRNKSQRKITGKIIPFDQFCL